jgi:hypothetical protein
MARNVPPGLLASGRADQTRIGCDVPLLGFPRLFQREAWVGEIGAGILQVGVEKPPIVLMGEVIVVCYMAHSRATRIAPTHPTQKCLQRPNDRVARPAPLLQLVAPQEFEQIPERPTLKNRRAGSRSVMQGRHQEITGAFVWGLTGQIVQAVADELRNEHHFAPPPSHIATLSGRGYGAVTSLPVVGGLHHQYCRI